MTQGCYGPFIFSKVKTMDTLSKLYTNTTFSYAQLLLNALMALHETLLINNNHNV